MRCPQCGFENIAGVDACANCHQSLTDMPPAVRHKSPIEESIEADTLAVLKPVEPLTLPPTAKVSDAVRLLCEKNIGCVLVVWGEALVGIFSERDVLMKIGTRYAEVASEPIRHFMTLAPVTLTAEDTIVYALNRMAVGDYRHIPIEADEKVSGIISVRDVLAYLAEHFPELTGNYN